MQEIFLDIRAGTLSRNPELMEWVQHSFVSAETIHTSGYERLRLHGENQADLYHLLETVIIQEGMHWMMQTEGRHYRKLLEADDYRIFQQQAENRMKKYDSKLRAAIREDIEPVLNKTGGLNVNGYLRFSAVKLKRILCRLLEEAYDSIKEEQEQEEFLSLLRFFVAVQPSLMEEAHLTFYDEGFTLTDEWGNDLRQIYLDTLLEEEITGISDNDLVMSILITLLPQKIYLSVESQADNSRFLFLLQQVFGSQLIWQKF